MDGRMDGRMDGWMDGWTDAWAPPSLLGDGFEFSFTKWLACLFRRGVHPPAVRDLGAGPFWGARRFHEEPILL